MKIFLDSGDLAAITYWMSTGAISGVTMNPLILGQQNVDDPVTHLKEVVAACAGVPISMQVDGGSAQSVREQARAYADLGADVVVKVPITDPEGDLMLPTIHELVGAGIQVNVTACMNAVQGILAAASGAPYVSLFAGRIEDEGGDASAQIRTLRDSIDSEGLRTQIIAGSVRQPGSIYPLIAAGSHICTVPPAVLHKAAIHQNSLRTVREFHAAATQ